MGVGGKNGVGGGNFKKKEAEQHEWQGLRFRVYKYVATHNGQIFYYNT